MPCSETNAAAETTDNRTTMPPIVDTPPKRAPRFDYIVMLCVIGAFLVAGGLITNSSRIMDVLWLMRTDNAAAITLPHLPVTLRNSGTETISLPVKGLCLLWPPKPYRWDYEGSYEFKHTDRTNIDSDMISVSARGERGVLIQLTKADPIHQTVTSLKRFFSTGDWHIQFIMETDQYGRNIINSDRIPFTKEAMAAGYIMEVFRKPSRREALN
jgi:hypothetical protein